MDGKIEAYSLFTASPSSWQDKDLKPGSQFFPSAAMLRLNIHAYTVHLLYKIVLALFILFSSTVLSSVQPIGNLTVCPHTCYGYLLPEQRGLILGI